MHECANKPCERGVVLGAQLTILPEYGTKFLATSAAVLHRWGASRCSPDAAPGGVEEDRGSHLEEFRNNWAYFGGVSALDTWASADRSRKSSQAIVLCLAHQVAPQLIGRAIWPSSRARSRSIAHMSWSFAAQCSFCPVFNFRRFLCYFG